MLLPAAINLTLTQTAFPREASSRRQHGGRPPEGLGENYDSRADRVPHVVKQSASGLEHPRQFRVKHCAVDVRGLTQCTGRWIMDDRGELAFRKALHQLRWAGVRDGGGCTLELLSKLKRVMDDGPKPAQGPYAALSARKSKTELLSLDTDATCQLADTPAVKRANRTRWRLSR